MNIHFWTEEECVGQEEWAIMQEIGQLEEDLSLRNDLVSRFIRDGHL